MKWPGGTGYEYGDTAGSVMTCDDTPDVDPLGRIALETWREDQAVWHEEHGIRDV